MNPRATLAACLLAAAAAARPDARHAGAVVYATATRLYLDAGAREGLAPGQVLQLRRAGHAAGSCRVEQVADDHGTCLGAGRPGDTFPLSPPPPPLAARHLPAPPAAATLREQRAALAAAGFDKVEFHEAPGAVTGARRAAVAVHDVAFASTGAGPWNQLRADVALRAFPVGAGFAVDLDVSARTWTRRSDPISFRPEATSQLYVWEASLSRRLATGGPAFAVGRVRPWGTPGQPILDGAQAGFRTAGGEEGGVFAGGLPDAVTLEPSTTHGTFGAYWAGQSSGGPDSTLRFLHHEARVAVLSTAELGRRVEAEGLVQASITRAFDGAINVRVAGGDHSAPGDLDALRLDGTFRPAPSFSVSGSFRYEGLSVPELDGPGVIGTGGAARHADAAASWEPAPALRVAVMAGLSSDLVSSLTRRWIGPELALPQLTGALGVSAGYFQESGWEPGRSVWLQGIVRSRGSFRLLARASWFRTSNAGPVDLDELSLSAAVEARFAERVAFRLTALGRTTLNGANTLFGGNTGQSGILDASLGGSF